WTELLVSPWRAPIASNTGSAAGGSDAVSAATGSSAAATARTAAISARDGQARSRAARALSCLERCGTSPFPRAARRSLEDDHRRVPLRLGELRIHLLELRPYDRRDGGVAHPVAVCGH